MSTTTAWDTNHTANVRRHEAARLGRLSHRGEPNIEITAPAPALSGDVTCICVTTSYFLLNYNYYMYFSCDVDRSIPDYSRNTSYLQQDTVGEALRVLRAPARVFQPRRPGRKRRVCFSDGEGHFLARKLYTIGVQRQKTVYLEFRQGYVNRAVQSADGELHPRADVQQEVLLSSRNNAGVVLQKETATEEYASFFIVYCFVLGVFLESSVIGACPRTSGFFTAMS